MSLKAGHSKTTEQCTADLKAAFSPEVDRPAQVHSSLSQNMFNKPAHSIEHSVPLDNLMPLSSAKYEHN